MFTDTLELENIESKIIQKMVVKILQIAKEKEEKETTPEELKKKTFIKFHIQENRGIHSNNHFGSKDKWVCKRMGYFMCKLQISQQRNQSIRNCKPILIGAYGYFVRHSTLTLKTKVIYDAFPSFNK